LLPALTAVVFNAEGTAVANAALENIHKETLKIVTARLRANIRDLLMQKTILT
jgi:hypothetical protein